MTPLQSRCAWLRSPDLRLELIEVPSDGQRVDLFDNTTALGLNHLAINVTGYESIYDFLVELNDESERIFERSIKIVKPPYQHIIGQDVYALAFVRGPDGVLLEFLWYETTLPGKMLPAWGEGSP